MAWQLIYTSSPRLLEAGRTGFGTVARHRAVGPLLASQLESTSQFARLTGYDSNRVIQAHRIIEAGSNRFHVLSCIQNAGSDYSGRTNHIAHHLIASHEEVAHLGRLGVTPADVIRAMEWKQAWTGAARFLEQDEEVDLGAVTPRSFQAWERLTRSADNARLPWSPQCERGCCLVVPPGQDALLVVGEAMSQQPAKSWDITFTTHVEPNDSLGDLRWICLSPDSPGMSQAQASARVLFDLTAPATLPALPPLPQAVSVAAAAPGRTAVTPERRTAASVPAPTGLDAASTWGSAMLAKADQAAAPAGMALPSSFAPAAARKKRSRLPVLAALVLGVALLGGGAFYVHTQQQEGAAWVARQKERVESIGLPAHDKVKQYLLGQIESGSPDKAAAEHLVTQAAEFWKNVADALELLESKRTVTFNPDDQELMARLGPVAERVNAWLAARQQLVAKLSGPGLASWTEVQPVLSAEIESWSQITKLPEGRQHLFSAARQRHDEQMRGLLGELLKQAPAGLQAYDAVARAVIVAIDGRAPAWVDLWERLTRMKPEEKFTDAELAAIADVKPPEWLREKLEARRKAAPAMAQATPTPPPTTFKSPSAAEPATPANPVMQSPGRTPGAAPPVAAPAAVNTRSTPVYVARLASLDELELAKVPRLNVEAGMELQVRDISKNATGETVTYSKHRATLEGLRYVSSVATYLPEKTFTFSVDRLVRVPGLLATKATGFHLRALAGGEVKFELYVQTRVETEVLSDLGPVKVAATLKQPGSYQLQAQGLLSRLRLRDGMSLRLMSESKPEAKHAVQITAPEAEVKMAGAEAADPVKLQADLKKKDKDITEATKSIEDIKQELKALEGSKRADRQKIIDSKTDFLTRKEEEMKLLVAEKARLEALKIPAPPPALTSGQYVLLGIGPGRADSPVRLCLVDLQVK